MKTLIVFDFDHTLVDDNSDTWLVRCAPDQNLPDWLMNTYQRGRWTEYMGRVMTYIGENAVSKEAIQREMETIPFTDGMIELLTFIGANKSEVDCIVVSDANCLFIEWILHAGGVRGAVDQVFSNPASFDERGFMTVRCHHSHQCSRCPVNMCKRKILEDFLAEKASGGVEYRRVFYAGDGGNDLCPAWCLRVGDVVLPRRGFTLEKLLERLQSGQAPQELQPVGLKPSVLPWASGTEILEELKTCIEKSTEGV
ncbi:pyridoxal phosphate phosphatase PHOSPHO2 [Hypomesus transpacificus]|uniref:pyridoxal phosphate phosphatase PHOSPHO2 n=1 Tax=Hypomesus transpacificus TaxID=137520 RepID=UPI001F073F5C|nr:pyridoxal phosphate phosphatase PHOSPHO2 [Hypomesus transpacificus]